MSGICLRMAYEGTHFYGWQKQPGLRSVQGSLEQAILSMDAQASEVRGASRTDKGVHAQGQIAAFNPSRTIPLQGWIRGLNAALPSDVVIQDLWEVRENYEPRFDAKYKQYRYLVELGPTHTPLIHHTTWHLGPARKGDCLDIDAIRQASAHFVGRHNFAAFRAQGDARDNTERTIHRVSISHPYYGIEKLLCIEVEGEAFLRHMVRIMVGTLLEVGQHRRAPDSLISLLRTDASRKEAGCTAPAKGLMLFHIELGRTS